MQQQQNYYVNLFCILYIFSRPLFLNILVKHTITNYSTIKYSNIKCIPQYSTLYCLFFIYDYLFLLYTIYSQSMPFIQKNPTLARYACIVRILCNYYVTYFRELIEKKQILRYNNLE